MFINLLHLGPNTGGYFINVERGAYFYLVSDSNMAQHGTDVEMVRHIPKTQAHIKFKNLKTA